MVNLDQYVVGSTLTLLILAWMLGPGGAANTLMPEKDVGPNGTDFNTSRLSFKPDLPQPVTITGEKVTNQKVISNSSVQINGTKIYWNGSTNDRGEDYGYIVFDVENRTDTVALEYNDASGFFQTPSIGFSVKDANNESGVLSTTRGSPQVIDLSGEDLEGVNIVELEIRVSLKDSWVDVGVEDVEADTGFFSTAVDYIQFALNSVTEAFKTLAAYIEFAVILPGGIGYIVLGFMAVLVAYLILDKAWVG